MRSIIVHIMSSVLLLTGCSSAAESPHTAEEHYYGRLAPAVGQPQPGQYPQQRQVQQPYPPGQYPQGYRNPQAVPQQPTTGYPTAHPAYPQAQPPAARVSAAPHVPTVPPPSAPTAPRAKVQQGVPQDYTRGLYEPFATDNVIPYVPRDNDEAFFNYNYYLDE